MTRSYSKFKYNALHNKNMVQLQLSQTFQHPQHDVSTLKHSCVLILLFSTNGGLNLKHYQRIYGKYK